MMCKYNLYILMVAMGHHSSPPKPDISFQWEDRNWDDNK